MSIIRINEFHAKSDKAAELLDFLKGITTVIRGLRGCLGVQLVKNHDDPTRLVVIEEWESIDAHKASVKNIPSEQIGKVMALLAEAPKGQYYETVEGT